MTDTDLMIPRRGLDDWAVQNGLPPGFKLMGQLDWLRCNPDKPQPAFVRYGRSVYYPESELLRYKRGEFS